MIRYRLCLVLLLLAGKSIYAQSNGTSKLDSLKINGYCDLYSAHDFLNPNSLSANLFVSSNQLNQIAINLAYLNVGFYKNNFSLQFTPALGTFMQANYRSEKNGTRWIYEAYAGWSVKGKKLTQIDVGVFTSPYTQENAISGQQIMYSRSLSTEYVPYYLSGIRNTFQLKKNLKFTSYLINGWQHLPSRTYLPALGTWLSWTKNSTTLNWTSYLGNEKTKNNPASTWRYFNEVNVERQFKKIKFQSCAYYGFQLVDKSLKHWWQMNAIASYSFNSKFSINGRVEYIRDRDEIQIQQYIDANGFHFIGSSLGLKYKPNAALSIGAELKSLHNNNGLNNLIGFLFIQTNF